LRARASVIFGVDNVGVDVVDVLPMMSLAFEASDENCSYHPSEMIMPGWHVCVIDNGSCSLCNL